MSYDLYVEKPKGDVPTQLRLLVAEPNSANAAKKFVQFAHGKASRFNNFIEQECKRLKLLGLLPTPPDMAVLPPGSWFLQFTFTLAKPWISKDDDPFYVAESVNPVRKDKVFKVPMMSAASWKGLLRWTVMHTQLTLQKNQLTADQFAQKRLDQSLLFGDEKGEEPGQTKDFAAYLDTLGGEEARKLYVQKIRDHFRLDEKAEMPHHSGRLMFYPTFFNLIDVEVINPHSRERGAGTHPIYLESVPAGAEGTFCLLYVPFDLIGAAEAEIRQQALADLKLVAEGLQALFLTYGFSAKRTSGFGVAEERLTDGVLTGRFPGLAAPAPTQPWPTWTFGSFTELADIPAKIAQQRQGGTP